MDEILNFLNRYKSVTSLFRTLFIVFLLSHFTACMWYFTARMDDFSPDCWVVRYGYENEDDGTLYLISFYFAFTILTTVGYGDIVAYTTEEVCIAILWMIFGVCVYSFIIGTLTALFAAMDAKQEAIEAKLNQFKYYADSMGLPADIRREIEKEIK